MGKATRESKSRIATGIVLAVLICAVLLFSHIPAVLLGTVVFLNVCAVYEIFQAAHMMSERKLFWAAIAGAVVISLIPILNYGNILPYVFGFGVLIFLRIMCRCGRCILDVPVRLCGICLLVVMLFRSIPTVRNLEHGFYRLIFAVVSCCVTDIFTYLTGKAFGKKKLCPKISPNKTVEGSVGGTLAATVILLLLGLLLERTAALQVNFAILTLYAVLSSLLGQFGDLSMSAVKRCLGVKDFGSIFPGHGGMLDRFDSLLFAAPFTYLFCRYIAAFFI